MERVEETVAVAMEAGRVAEARAAARAAARAVAREAAGRR